MQPTELIDAISIYERVLQKLYHFKNTTVAHSISYEAIFRTQNIGTIITA